MYKFVLFLILCNYDLLVNSENCLNDQSSVSSNILSHLNSVNSTKFKNKVILILADGIRYDYLNNLNEYKGFQKLATNGVRAEVRPIFPSNSYPNWYTILTGLYAENHGMVQNFMRDPKYNETFMMTEESGSQHEHWWSDDDKNGTVEPLWITAEKNGIKTAVFYWDGCGVKISNMLPSYCVKYKSYWSWMNLKEDYQNALDMILNNFESNKWQFALVYYEPIDSNGHVFGPNSVPRKDATKDLDDLLFYLQEELKKKHLDDQVHIVLVSDHGMLNVQSKIEKTEIIDIEDYVDSSDVDVMLDRGSMSLLVPKSKIHEDRIIAALKKASPKGMQFFRKSEIPDKYHYKHHRRISPIMLLADKGYFIRGFREDGKTKPTYDIVYKGHHGYNPLEIDEMRTIMFASGPKLKRNHLNGELMMTDHYNLICNLLNIKPLKNDGNITRIIGMLNMDDNHTTNNLANRTIIPTRSKLNKIIRSIEKESKLKKTIKNNSNDQLDNLILISLFFIFNLLITQYKIHKF